jgi:hemerythrin
MPSLDIEYAIDAHLAWRRRFEIVLGGHAEEQFDVATICDDSKCVLGHWLHGKGHSHIDESALQQLIEVHRNFHHVASRIARFANDGNDDVARQLLESEFTSMSDAIIKLLRHMRQQGQDSSDTPRSKGYSPITMSDKTNISEWKPEYSVGNEEMDKQHKRIFDICRRVHDLPLVNTAQSISTAHELLDEAAQFARTHFHSEEYLLRKFNYVDLKNHLEEHRQFEETLSNLLFDAIDGKISAREFSLFLSNWLKDHIIETDMKYKSLFS